MILNRTTEYLKDLINELRRLPSETEWVEFKVDNTDPQTIAKNMSALANSTALRSRASAYIVWGIEDSTHSVVGTSFSPSVARIGNEPLENWLSRTLAPSIEFHFREIALDDRTIVILEIQPASRQPIAFKGDEFIRVGSVTKRLRDHPELERSLWRVFDRANFEDGMAVEHVSDRYVLDNLDYSAYFDLLRVPIPDGRAAIINVLCDHGLISRCDAGGWNVTNLGAMLFAKDLRAFPRLKRKAARVVQYRGGGRLETLKEQEYAIGYASGFETLVRYIMAVAPSNEVIEHSLRRTVPMFPELAIRELAANALIHQDFSVTGAGPMVEIFNDRIEITSPGEPLVDTNRFVDTPPKSRNETLASLMRRLGICEERGSGIDKVVSQVEMFQLPPPLFEAPEDFTRATLFAHKNLSDMNRTERVRACYLHACLRYVLNQPMNNTSIRERFGISAKNSARASRILSEALDAGCIVIRDPEAGTRNRTYLPFWAA